MGARRRVSTRHSTMAEHDQNQPCTEASPSSTNRATAFRIRLSVVPRCSAISRAVRLGQLSEIDPLVELADPEGAEHRASSWSQPLGGPSGR